MSLAGGSFEEIEHTADWAIRVTAPTLEALFAAAARGMFSLLRAEEVANAAIGAARVRSLRLAAVDAETLLIDWLNELLFLSEDESILFHAFTVDIEMAGSGVSLVAEAHGAPAGRLEKTIKAATFSGLAIESRQSSSVATIVFDV